MSSIEFWEGDSSQTAQYERAFTPATTTVFESFRNLDNEVLDEATIAEDPVRQYLHEVAETRLLTSSEELLLARHIETGKMVTKIHSDLLAAKVGEPTLVPGKAVAISSKNTRISPHEFYREVAKRFKQHVFLFQRYGDALLADSKPIPKLGEIVKPDEKSVQEVASEMGESMDEIKKRIIEISTLAEILPEEVQDVLLEPTDTRDPETVIERVPSAVLEERLFKIAMERDEAIDVFPKANLRLVVDVAKKHFTHKMSLLDRIQEGNIGLLRALQTYDYRKGFKFSTYATWWIRQAVTRSIADQNRTIRVPVHMIELISKMDRIERRLQQDLGRDVEKGELADELELSVEKIDEIIRTKALEPASLETPVGDDEKSNIGDFLPDQTNVSMDEVAVVSDRQARVDTVLTTLSPREQEVIKLRFGIGYDKVYTLSEIGKRLGVTRERIRQIEAKVVRKLRDPEIIEKLRGLLDE